MLFLLFYDQMRDHRTLLPKPLIFFFFSFFFSFIIVFLPYYI